MACIKLILLTTFVFITGCACVSPLKKEDALALEKLKIDYKAKYGIALKQKIVIRYMNFSNLNRNGICRDFKDGIRTLFINTRFGKMSKDEELKYVHACAIDEFPTHYYQHYL